MASRSRASRQPPPPAPPWVPVAISGIAVVLGLVITYFGYPGLLATWVGFLTATSSSQPPELTGKDPATKNPIPNGPRETRDYQRYQFWRSMKWGLVLPVSAFVPGWPLRGPFLASLVAAAAFFCLPYEALPIQYPSIALPAANAFFAFVLIGQTCASRRDTVEPGDRSPGAKIDSLGEIFADEPTKRRLIFAAATVSGLLAASALSAFAPPTNRYVPGPVAPFVWAPIAFFAVFGAIIARPWVDAALDQWRIVVAARKEWLPRWTMLKHQAAPPRLNDRQNIGPATIDSFTADGQMGGAGTYLALGQKIVPTMGRPIQLAVLPMESKDGQGQPIPGSVDPSDFQIVTWPADYSLDIADPSVDFELAKLWLSCTLAWLTEGAYVAPSIAEMTPIGVPAAPEEPNPILDPETGEQLLDEATGEPLFEPADEPGPLTAQAYAVTLYLRGGLGYESLRKEYAGAIAARVGSEALVDHRPPSQNKPTGQALYVGALTYEPPAFAPDSGVTVEFLTNLSVEDEWNTRWAAVLKQDVNPPTIEHRAYAEHKVAGGIIKRQGFIPRQGVDPRDFFGLEAKIAATLNGAPFVSVTGWLGQASRVAERHAQAFAVVWSSNQLPANPDQLRPDVKPSPASRGARGPEGGTDERRRSPRDPRRPRPGAGAELPAHNDGHLWLLSGIMNRAFKGARLAQPETYEVRCLTLPRSTGHIWEMKIRLYDGVTLADVRGASQRLRQALGSEFLRVTESGDGCVIVCGADPKRVRLAEPTKDMPYLVSLSWEQAFLDAKVSGVGGLTPRLEAVDHLPKNEKVEVLTFSLPSGLDLPTLKAATKKLETATSNAFVEVRRGPSGKSDEVTILACEVPPMPERASIDWEEADANGEKIPFATSLTGEAVCYDNRLDAHLLVSGASGGGKMAPLTTRFPVPVSERFPDGWATNGDLRIGDQVYAADGTVTTVTGFSDIVTDSVYRLTLSDGQTIEAGAHHLWKVSTRYGRSAHRGAAADRHSARLAEYTGRAEDIRALANLTGPTHVATLTEIARLVGMNETVLYQLNLPLTHLGVAMQVPSNKKSRVFDVEAVADYFLDQAAKKKLLGQPHVFAGHTVLVKHIEGMREAGRKMDGWLTTRAMCDALLGHESTRKERAAMKQVTARGSFAHRDGLTTFTTTVYPVDETLRLIADHLDYWGTRSDNDRQIQPLETILNSQELLAAGLNRGFAIRLARPIDGAEIDARVDPYVLGAWLGGGITVGTGDLAHARSSLEDTDALSDLGVLHRKHIPADYLRASYDQRLALLQGLMDTDGSVDEDGGCELSLADERLARDAQELLRTLGIYTTIRRAPAMITEDDPHNPDQNRRRRTGWLWRQQFTTDLPIFRLPQKAARLKATATLRATQDWLYIESIDVREPEPMRCIAVDHPDHLYLTDGFVPTHNSVALQNFIYGAVIRGWDLYVMDPSKGAVDFQFAEDWAVAFGRTVWQTRGIVEAIYNEVLRRKAINARYNCGNYRDLPDEARYNHVLVVMDEFTSMMMPEPVPKAVSNDPDVLAGIAEAQAMNAARAYIGTFVGKIVREARSTGFTMLLATQALKADTLQKIPGANDLKDNMSRMIVGRASFGQLAAALKMPQDAPEQPEVLPPGRGLYEGNGRPAETIQTWFEGSQQVLTEQISARRPRLDPERKLDVDQFVAPELEVEGGIIDGPDGFPATSPSPTPPGSPSAPALPEAAIPQVVELEPVAFSLDDLEAVLDEDEPSDTVEEITADPESGDFRWPSAPSPVEQAAVTSPIPDADDDEAPWPPDTPSDTPPAPSAEVAGASVKLDWSLLEESAPDEADAEDDLDWSSITLTDAPVDVGDLTSDETLEESAHQPGNSPVVEAAVPDASFEEAVVMPTEDLLDPDAVVIDTDIVWDEIDPSPWEPTESEYGWTEIDALMGFLDNYPHVLRVTWEDPHLLDVDEIGVVLADLVEEILDERGVVFTGPQPSAPASSPLQTPNQDAPQAVPALTPEVAPSVTEAATPAVTTAVTDPEASFGPQEPEPSGAVAAAPDHDSSLEPSLDPSLATFLRPAPVTVAGGVQAASRPAEQVPPSTTPAPAAPAAPPADRTPAPSPVAGVRATEADAAHLFITPSAPDDDFDSRTRLPIHLLLGDEDF